MGMPRKVLVLPQGYLWEAVRDWYDNDPANRWTKKGKSKAIIRRVELQDKIEILIHHTYSPMFDKYCWETEIRRRGQHASYYIEFFLSEEYLNE
jgi:hypothetical protein